MENKRTWLYCRVAYPDAHDLASQQATLESYAEKHGFEIVGMTSEHASGLDNPREGLYEVFRAVDSGQVDFLLVENLSRLSRDLMATNAYLRWLEDRFVEVICADGTVPRTQEEILLDVVRESKR